jgi:hypothetical protein
MRQAQAGDEELVPQGDGAFLLDDDVQRDVRTDGADPAGQGLEVGDGGRQTQDPNVLGREDDGLLPDRAALDVVEVVDLVEDDVADVVEGFRGLEDRVAEDLRGHEDDLRVRIERDVAGLDADAVAVEGGEVAELLVGERLDGGRVEDAGAFPEAALDGVLGHEGLARARGGGHDEGLAGVDDLDGALLERIQGDALILHERGEREEGGRGGGGLREKDPRGVRVL